MIEINIGTKMLSDSGTRPLYSPIYIGILVKDVDKTSKFLSSTLGIKAWEIIEELSYTEMMVGKPFRLKVAKNDLGPVILELLHPLDDEALLAELLQTKGEGLHHIAFGISNWSETASKLQEQGCRMILGGVNQGKRWAYFETESSGFIIALAEK